MVFSADILAVLSGLASAASWGTGDFSGGMATRRGNAYSVVIISEVIGTLFLIVIALATRESMPPAPDLLLAAVAGVAGALGLLSLYQAMANGQMGVAAPVAAVLAAGIPVAFGIAEKGLPGQLKLVGFGLGLVGLWLVSRSGTTGATRSGLRLAIFAGVGFAAYYIMIEQATHHALFWPLIADRFLSIAALFAIARATRQPWQIDQGSMPWIAVVGLCNIGGNFFFALATQLGRLDISAVLASAAPVFTVVPALLVAKEKLNRRQLAGITLMMTAIILFAVKETPLT